MTFSFFRSAISSSEKPASLNTSLVWLPGLGGGDGTPAVVRLNRGAGAGCITPSISTNVPRSALCGCLGASSKLRTGAKQISVASIISHHWSRVFVLNNALNLLFNSGHPADLNLRGSSQLAAQLFRYFSQLHVSTDFRKTSCIYELSWKTFQVRMIT